MKTLYLHIGQYKTGRSSMQKFCSENSLWLENKGFYYASNDAKPYVDFNQHSPLVVSIFKVHDGYLPEHKNDITDYAFDLFIKDVNDVDVPNVILSSEAFFKHSDKQDKLKLLKERLSNTFKTIKIIVYLRRHDEWYLSLYQQHARSGDTGLVNVDPLEMIKERHFRIKEQLDGWKNIFGIENIIVRPFNKECWKYESIISDFLSLLGVDAKVENGEYNENKSISLQQLQLLDLLNEHLTPLTAYDQESRFEDHLLRHYLLSLDLSLSKGEIKDLLSSDVKKQILSLCKEDIDFINDTYTQKIGKPIFNMEVAESSKYDPLRLEDLVVVIKELLNHYKSLDERNVLLQREIDNILNSKI